MEPRLKKNKIIVINITKENTEEEKQKLIENIRDLDKHRSNIIEILRNSNATPIRCRSGLGYVCYFCTEQYSNPASLKKHTTKVHHEDAVFSVIKTKQNMFTYHVKLDITNLKCNLCEDNIDTLERLIEHLRDMHGKKIFTDIKNQIIPFKFDNDREKLTCFLCNSTFDKFKLLLQHMNTHYRNHICEVCGAGFVSRIMLSDHSECHKRGRFSCDFCSKVFNTKRKKEYHENSTHKQTVKRNKCVYCDEKFREYLQKEKHMVEIHGHQSAEVKCQVCDKLFFNRKRLTAHIKRLHSVERRHECSECDMHFFTSEELRNHLVKHTGLKNFKCKICHKTYGRKKTLTEHMKIHSDDRRFKCERCGQAFVQKCSWRSHMRSRHGEEV